MFLQSKDFTIYPKFRHNLWMIDEQSDTAELTVSHSKFDVPLEHARKFLGIRGYCTGHNTIEQIAEKSGRSVTDVKEVVGALIEAELLHLHIQPIEELSEQNIREQLMAACRIWSEQLAQTYIGFEVMAGLAPRKAAVGWLLETYHYVRMFPEALHVAEERAKGRLRVLLRDYASQETGHERFILASLMKLGFAKDEIEQSIPLVSTRLIDMLMRELFALEPCSALLVAAIIEADNYDPVEIENTQALLADRYGLSRDVFKPFFEHVRIDAEMGHAKLLERNTELLTLANRTNLHDVVNKLHDLKHAFDVQSLEIKEYYRDLPGNYIPRQYVDFFAI